MLNLLGCNKENFKKIRKFRSTYPGKKIHVDGGVNGEVSARRLARPDAAALARRPPCSCRPAPQKEERKMATDSDNLWPHTTPRAPQHPPGTQRVNEKRAHA